LAGRLLADFNACAAQLGLRPGGAAAAPRPHRQVFTSKKSSFYGSSASRLQLFKLPLWGGMLRLLRTMLEKCTGQNFGAGKILPYPPKRGRIKLSTKKINLAAPCHI
jgi:hypothetical protein